MSPNSTNGRNGSRATNGGIKGTFAQWLLAKRNWWLQFAVVSGISIVGLLALGTWTYQGAPPLASFVSSTSSKGACLSLVPSKS